MFPKYHFLLGFIFSLIIFFLFPEIGVFGVVIIFLSSFLIDFDHYLYYIFEKRDFSLKRAYLWYEGKGKIMGRIKRALRKNYFVAYYYFHGMEWVLLFVLLGYFLNEIFLFIAIGMVFHLFLDWITSIIKNDNLSKFSLILNFAKRKSLKKI